MSKKKNRKNIYLKLLIFIGACFFLYWFVIYISQGVSSTVKTEVKICFIKKGQPLLVARNISLQNSLAEISQANRSLKLLTHGPNKIEKLLGVYSEVPPNLSVLSINQEGTTMIVNFSDTLNANNSNIQSIIMQIVYTLTELRSVTSVKFLINGSSQIVIGNEGYILDKPIYRKDIILKK